MLYGRTIKSVIAAAILALTSSNVLFTPINAAEADVDPAILTSTRWLELIDQRKYRQAWDETSEIYRRQTTYGEWENTISGLRNRWGEVISRKWKSREALDRPPRPPFGTDVMVGFDTEFTNNWRVRETVKTLLESDGKWRVYSYFAK